MNHDYFNNIALSEVCSRMVDESGRPLKAIAAEIGKGYSTLYRELDASDEGGKLGVDTLMPLIRACHELPLKNPPMPVIWLNSKCGFRAVPIAAEPDHADCRDEALDDMRALTAFQDAMRDGKSLPSLVARLGQMAQAEIEETIEQYRREYEARDK